MNNYNFKKIMNDITGSTTSLYGYACKNTFNVLCVIGLKYGVDIGKEFESLKPDNANVVESISCLESIAKAVTSGYSDKLVHFEEASGTLFMSVVSLTEAKRWDDLNDLENLLDRTAVMVIRINA